MIRFLFRRLTFIVLVCLMIIYFAHLGIAMARNSDLATPNFDLIAFSRSAWSETTEYIGDALTGEFGTVPTDTGPTPISEFAGRAYRNSMGLLLVALVAAAGLGLAFGSFAALTRFRRLVLPLLTLTLLGISTPSFFAGVILQLGELKYLQIFGRRLVSMAGFAWDFDHMLLPVLVLLARPLAYLTRATYLGLKSIMDEDFIRTAYAKGLGQRRVVNVHAFRNLAIPVLTAIGVSLRFSLSTLPIAEIFFAWPGMGQELVRAIYGRQAHLVATLALALGLTFLLANLLLDILFRIIDPRTREWA
jgi:ABC-type dipeptide/oligopeptide/nickel transport system permease component